MNKIFKHTANCFALSFAFLGLLPIAILLLWSISGKWNWPNILPQNYNLRAYRYILENGNQLLKVVFFSIGLSLSVTFITILFSIPAAKALGTFNFIGKRLVEILILTPLIIPSITIATGIHIFFIRLGLADTLLGVIIIHLFPCLPYGVRMLKNVYEVIGNSYEIQARVLGASRLKTFLNITLPLLMPAIISASNLIFVVSFSQYLLTLIIGGGKIMTLAVIMFPFIQDGDQTMAGALSIVFISVSFVFLIIFEKMLKNYYKIEGHLYI
ncbi:ABC transporter, permease protein [Clostridiales bacterium oral taxon 876 str. F0540]|nr:ABC transporter, permease protein [Clostridiales bacterium oral taxon 876 str. F0540]